MVNTNCTLASLSWLIGRHVEYTKAYEMVWPVDGQQCQRGVTMDELYDMGYVFVTLHAMPMAWNGVQGCEPIPVYEDPMARIKRLIATTSGLLIGRTANMGHCLAYKDAGIFDPRYGVLDKMPDDFSLQTIHIYASHHCVTQ
jgi:hypothetical protein